MWLASLLLLLTVMSAVSGASLDVKDRITENSAPKFLVVEKGKDVKNDQQSDILDLSSNIDKIVGGNFAVHGEFPYQARIGIEYISSEGIKWDQCGASILNDNWLLTAAHCLTDDIVKITVFLGDHDSETEDIGEQKFIAERFILHEDFIRAEDGDDIALIKIANNDDGTGIIFSKYVQPISLPKLATPYKEGTKCTISGWGTDNPAVRVSQRYLKTAEIFLVNQKKCARQYKCDYPHSITDTVVCAGFPNGGVDSCMGDSGGPLVCNIEGVDLQLGIVSWGIGCANRRFSGIYTRVTSFLSWIEQHMD